MKKMVFVLLIYAISLSAQSTLKLVTSMYGEKDGDAFSSVCSLGDVNGDGYNDFIVGSQPGKINGYAKLYFGGHLFDTLNCVRFQSHESFTSYNGSFAGNGDLNGDGYKDFVLGAAYDILQYGKIFIHFGKAKIDTLADKTITGNGAYYHFGAHIAMNGDLNGDGYDDLVVSAPNDFIDAHGRVYIYFGGKTFDTECDVLLEGKEPFDSFGGAIAFVGDTNGDGYDDFLVSAPQILTNKKPGKAYLFYGGKEIGFNNCKEFIGQDSIRGSYGIKVAGLGDINGDSFCDFGIVSSTTAEVFDGKQLKSLFTINSEQKYWYPLCISNGEDINNDGFSDFALSSANQEDQYSGEVAIYFGAKSVKDTPLIIIKGEVENGYLGTSLAMSKSIDSNSYSEVFIGENGELTQNGNLGSGKISLYKFAIGDGIDDFQKTLRLPNSFKLYDNYPNPFNPTTQINFVLKQNGKVTLKVYDVLGKEVANLVDGLLEAGKHTATFDGGNLASGIYFYRLSTPTSTITKKMMLVK